MIKLDNNIKKIYLMMKSVIIICMVLLFFTQTTSATMVSEGLLVNLEGHPGDTIELNITLTGVIEESTRIGHWNIIYVDRETDKRGTDIRKWISIEPKNYIIKYGESKTFDITIQIPSGISPGIYGATSIFSGVGHMHNRSTYIEFVDADKETIELEEMAPIWIGIRIPISVIVLGEPCPFDEIKWIVQNNIVIISLATIIIALSGLILIKAKNEKN